MVPPLGCAVPYSNQPWKRRWACLTPTPPPQMAFLPQLRGRAACQTRAIPDRWHHSHRRLPRRPTDLPSGNSKALHIELPADTEDTAPDVAACFVFCSRSNWKQQGFNVAAVKKVSINIVGPPTETSDHSTGNTPILRTWLRHKALKHGPLDAGGRILRIRNRTGRLSPPKIAPPPSRMSHSGALRTFTGAGRRQGRDLQSQLTRSISDLLVNRTNAWTTEPLFTNLSYLQESSSQKPSNTASLNLPSRTLKSQIERRAKLGIAPTRTSTIAASGSLEKC